MIAAVIVSYNPDLNLLDKNINSIIHQVDKLIIYDNNSRNRNDLLKRYCDLPGVELKLSESNDGISKALNNSIFSLDDRFDWVLTLDQDSICPSNLIIEFSKFFKLDDIALICPSIQLTNGISIQQCAKNTEYQYIERCITSASLMNIKLFREIGGFDEFFFIDNVDHEICKRIIIAGYKILLCGNVTLLHNLGSSSPVLFSVWLNKHFHTKIIYQTYSPFRIYYLVRNSIYFIRKFRKHMKIREYYYYVRLIFWHVSFKSLIVGNEKISIIKAIFKGTLDGVSCKVEPLR